MKIFLVLLLIAASASTAVGSSASSSTHHRHPHRRLNTDELVARTLANNNNNNAASADYSFLSGYNLKFQGCHHVQQWNSNTDSSSDVRIRTKRLARFRLCPSDTCNSQKSAGCTSKYGDYILDLSSFVSSYLSVVAAEKTQLCASAATDCANLCTSGNGDNTDDCTIGCYNNYGLSSCLDDGNDANNNFSPSNYASCTQVDIGSTDDAQQYHYIGPYCADQGGDVLLGVFTDDSCTSFATNGTDLFASARGFALPYSNSTTSLISTRCVSCQDYSNSNDDKASSSSASSGCTSMYTVAGKCETRMENLQYPNEASCSYMEGIKIVRQDGVIRTSSVRQSKSAAVGIGLATTSAVLLAAYVYYLQTKLARAQINLQAAAQPLC
jgi:hypothetical protein